MSEFIVIVPAVTVFLLVFVIGLVSAMRTRPSRLVATSAEQSAKMMADALRALDRLDWKRIEEISQDTPCEPAQGVFEDAPPCPACMAIFGCRELLAARAALKAWDDAFLAGLDK